MAILAREEGSIFYSVQGEGEPLLMLRGLGRSSRYWLGFDRVMSQHFKVITIDQRGLGRSTQKMNWDDSIETLASDTLAVIDALKIEKFHVFGLSLGGMIASAVAWQAPQRILSLAIASSSSADYIGFRLSPIVLPKLLFALRRGDFQGSLLKAVVPKAVLRSWGHEIQASWQEILQLEGFPLLTLLKQLRISFSHRLKGRLEEGTYPLLFIHGSMDTFVPLGNSKQMHRLFKQSQLIILKGAGHEIALGHEAELCRILRNFARSA